MTVAVDSEFEDIRREILILDKAICVVDCPHGHGPEPIASFVIRRS